MPDSIDNHIACDKHCEFVDIAFFQTAKGLPKRKGEYCLKLKRHCLGLGFENLSSTGAGCEGRLGLKKPVQNLIMDAPHVLCTFGWRVAEPSLARSEAVGLRLIHQPGPDQRLFHFDDVMIHPYAVLGFLVFCAAAAWTMALIV